MHPWKHFLTITKHRHLVMAGCFRVGLIWQGLVHDLSKYSAAEFLQGARFWQGTRSPNALAREQIGWSTAWMHHKGRNRHHYEYWTDLDPVTHRYTAMPMPTRYVIESVMDRIAACKTYHGKNYTDADPLEYLIRASQTERLHETNREQLIFLLTMLRDKGEKKTFRFIRQVVRRNVAFSKWEALQNVYD